MAAHSRFPKISHCQTATNGHQPRARACSIGRVLINSRRNAPKLSCGFGRAVVQKPRTKADTRLAYSNGNHVRHHGWHMRNMRPVAEDELQRVLTFWQRDHGFGLSRPEMQVVIISRNWLL